MMKMDLASRWMRLVCACAMLMPVAIAGAQEAPKDQPKEDYVKAHYTKYEYRIPDA